MFWVSTDLITPLSLSNIKLSKTSAQNSVMPRNADILCYKTLSRNYIFTSKFTTKLSTTKFWFTSPKLVLSEEYCILNNYWSSSTECFYTSLLLLKGEFFWLYSFITLRRQNSESLWNNERQVSHFKQKPYCESFILFVHVYITNIYLLLVATEYRLFD